VRQALTNPHFDKEQVEKNRERQQKKERSIRDARDAEADAQREAERRKSKKTKEEEVARKRRIKMAAEMKPPATSFKVSGLNLKFDNLHLSPSLACAYSRFRRKILNQILTSKIDIFAANLLVAPFIQSGIKLNWCWWFGI
jgi:hypothetical protein